MRKYAVGDEPVPGYRLVRFLGSGSFSNVWEAVGPGEVEVALKIHGMQDKQGLKEFRAVRLVKNIRHPNLSPPYAFLLKDEHRTLHHRDAQASVELAGPTRPLIPMARG